MNCDRLEAEVATGGGRARGGTMTREGLRIRKTSRLAAAAASVIACVLCLGLVSAAQAAPGDLDPTFSGDGKQMIDFGGSESGSDVVLQADGKIVVVGGTSGDFALSRYNTDGSLDVTFSGDGKQTTDFPGEIHSASDVALQVDGKILVAGDYVLVRYNTDGSLDTTFSDDGILATNVAVALAIQADGKIVVVGTVLEYPASDFVPYPPTDFAVARYNSDGTVDTSFSDDGWLTSGLYDASDTGREVAIQPDDGKIVVVGDGALARYNTDGSPDTTFSGDGGWGAALAIQADGDIVVGGTSDPPPPCSGCTDPLPDFALARYDSDGTPDTSFSGDGIQTTDFGSWDYGESVAVHPDGKIVVAGNAYQGGTDDFAVARYNADGTLDTSFSGDGKQTTDFGGYLGGWDRVGAVAIQPDGNIVVVGTNSAHPVCFCPDSRPDIALARYEGGSGAPDTTAPETTITAGPAGTTNDSTPTFGFDSSEGGSTFECSVDGSAFSPCSSPHTTSPLSDGPHTFEVRATDLAGNLDASPASRGFTVDAAPPVVTITAPAPGATVAGSVSVAADALDNLAVAGVQFTLDGTSLGTEDTLAPYAVTWDTRTSVNGPHVVSALARDAAGNPAAATNVSVTVDNDKSAPTAPTNVSAVPVSSSEIDLAWSPATDNVGVAGYRVTRDGAAIATTSATSFKNTGLASRTTYTYSVAAFDAAGNVSSDSAPLNATTPAPPAAGLAAAYRFGEGAGTTTADGSPNANNGALVNGAAWTTGGRYGSAINFDGLNDHVRVADSASLDIGRTGTVEAWVKLDTLNRWHGVVAKGNANQDQSHNYAVEINNSNRWLCILGNGTSRVVLQSSTTARANQFIHVACVWNGTTVQLYLDGVLNASATQTITPAANSSPLYIGQFGGNADRLDGVVDEVRIYNRALAQAEIQNDRSTPL
jgi:uncharacterized delta-60 repeat protein